VLPIGQENLVRQPDTQPRPAEGVFALLDVLPGGAEPVVEPHDSVQIRGIASRK
jgi:hypothetical protein